MSASRRVLVVQHQDSCPPDRLGQWLGEAGVALDVRRPYRGEPLPARAPSGGLLVLGGSMGAHDDDAAPWLPATRALLAGAVDDRVPTLGICLGAQLLAAACGGRVEVGADGIEAGVLDVEWLPAAADDPVFGTGTGTDAGSGTGPGPGTAAPSMHLDAVTRLPTGAVWLGRGDGYPHQAFRVGPCAWGTQFHPEVSPATFRSWSASHADDWPRWGMSGDEVVGQLVARDHEVVAAGRRLAGRFAAVVQGVGADRALTAP